MTELMMLLLQLHGKLIVQLGETLPGRLPEMLTGKLTQQLMRLLKQLSLLQWQPWILNEIPSGLLTQQVRQQ